MFLFIVPGTGTYKRKMQKYFDNEKKLFAFNIWDINSAKAVMDAAANCSQNVILQTSSSIYQDIPRRRVREFVAGYQNEIGIKTWLHLDHCKDPALIYDAIDNGWDSVMIDASASSLDENIRITNEITVYAHSKGVPVEAEVGRVQGVEDDIKSISSAFATKEDIRTFLSGTDIDLIAVAFGNAHGEYKTIPDLHYELVEYTTSITKVPFVVHGGSGMTDSALKRLIEIDGVLKINISTDVKLAYLAGIKKAGADSLLNKDGFNAHKVEKCIGREITRMVETKLSLLKIRI